MTGVAFRVLERGGRAEWFLNYRSGAFLVPGDGATVRDAALAGVTTEPEISYWRHLNTGDDVG